MCNIRRTVLCLIALIVTVAMLVSCEGAASGGANGNSSDTAVSDTNTSSSEFSDAVVTEDKSQTEKATTEQEGAESDNSENDAAESWGETATETESESESEIESETNESEVDAMNPIDITEFNVTPALPEASANKRYTAGDGSLMLQYNNMKKDAYLATCSYYLSEGYTAYSKNTVGEACSLVLTRGDELCTVFYSGSSSELYLTTSSLADTLPQVGEEYEKVCEVSVTQHYSEKINGMGYVVRLEDGSLIIYDGGYDTDADDLYAIICEMSPFDRPHIRAWILTHSHGDHCTAFSVIAQKYAQNIDLDTLIYAPVNSLAESGEKNGYDYFDNSLPGHVAMFDRAVLCPVHTGMSFNMAGVTLEVLLTNEYIGNNKVINDLNEASTITRIVSDDGSVLFTGDIGVAGCDWMVSAYGDALKSDMIQVSHHGCETATAEFYDKVAAPVLFWPCNENLFGQYRGELVKQHLIEAEYSVEHILHGYGTVTRVLSYKPQAPEYIDLSPKNQAFLKAGPRIENARIEDGVLKYEVVDPTDPYLSVSLKKIDTGKCNMLRIVAGADDCESSDVFVTYGDMAAGAYTAACKKDVGRQGTSNDGKMTLIVYLGNLPDFNGDINAVRFDFGTEAGQTVEIYSIEAYYVDFN